MKRTDLHMHTGYSFDTDETQTMERYCLKAISEGIDVICFTDHIEYNIFKNTFDDFRFKKRYEEFHRMKDRYKDRLKVLIGYEVGQPHLHKEVVQALKNMECDMIIGSIHFSEDPKLRMSFNYKEKWERRYDEMLLDMVEYGQFNVVGHMDVLKKWNYPDYVRDFEAQKRIIEKIVEKGLIPEVNSSSYCVGANEPMPGYDLLEYYRDCGGTYLTFGSDAHKVERLGGGYEKVIENLPEGLKFCYFEKGVLKEA